MILNWCSASNAFSAGTLVIIEEKKNKLWDNLSKYVGKGSELKVALFY
jgi:hypothetical protein